MPPPDAAHTPLLNARAHLETFQVGADVIVTEDGVRHRARISRALHHPKKTDQDRWQALRVRAVAIPVRTDPPVVWAVDVAGLAEGRIEIEHLDRADAGAVLAYVANRDAQGVTGLEFLATLFEFELCVSCGNGADAHSAMLGLFGLWHAYCDTLQS